MIINTDFLNYVLSKYAQADTTIHITDATTRILASTNMERVGDNSRTAQYIIQVMRPSTIESMAEDKSNTHDRITYGTPILFDKEICGTVIVQGPATIAVQQGNTIRSSLETAFEYEQ